MQAITRKKKSLLGQRLLSKQKKLKSKRLINFLIFSITKRKQI